jgi:CRISPR-associated protein Csx17
MPDLILSGCSPVPLAHYLKALGILRLVAESAHGDAAATAHWSGNDFVLTSRFDREPLLSEFFLRDYQPTPLMVPWSGGDFFAVNREKPANSFDKTPTSARVIESILSTDSARFEDYRTALRATFSAMDRAGVRVKKDIEGSGGPQRRLKAEMLKSLRNSLPDGALAWMDAAAVIEPDAVAFNSLLGGGGGSDGNSHFSDNFMQSLWMALPEFDTQRKKAVKAIGESAVFNSCAALDESLFGIQGAGTKIPDLSPVLFDSTRVGGPNQTTGFEAKAGSNPWDFILMLEGSVLFAGAIGRKLDDNRDPSARFPFLFQASPVGLGSSYHGESSGRELWLPLWSKPAMLTEIRALLGEGRVEKHGRMAKRGTDAFVAAAQLGFDRGITAFQRVGFFKGRIGGDNYFTAIDQGRITPRRNQSVDLLRDIDDWLTKLASASTSDRCPASVAAKVVALERRIADLAVTSQKEAPPRLIAVLAALGATERALAKSYKWTTESAYLRPLHGLKPQWLTDADDGSTEFRLAASLAGMRAWLGGKETLYFRQHLEPLDMGANKERSWASWAKTPGNDVVWHDGDLAGALNAILARRLIRAEKSGARGWPDFSPCVAKLADITAFIEGRTNDALLADLIWGLSLIDWQAVSHQQHEARISERERVSDTAEHISNGSRDDEQHAIPSAFYALLRLCFRAAKGDDAIPLHPAILNRAMSGDGTAASELASRRLRASGKAPLVASLPVRGDIARRTAAAMLFPISNRDLHLLEHMILKKQNQQNT